MCPVEIYADVPLMSERTKLIARLNLDAIENIKALLNCTCRRRTNTKSSLQGTGYVADPYITRSNIPSMTFLDFKILLNNGYRLFSSL